MWGDIRIGLIKSPENDLSEDLFCQFPRAWSASLLISTPSSFQGCWGSIPAVAYDSICADADSKCQSPVHIHTSISQCNLGRDIKYIGGLEWKGGIWKEWEEYPWVIREQCCNLDPEVRQLSFLVLEWAFLVVVMVTVNCHGACGHII